jgi:hexosaminidase
MRPLAFLLALSPVLLIGQDLALMPWPTQVERHQGQLPFIAPLRARVDGPSSERIDQAVARWSARMADRNGPVARPDSTASTPLLVHFTSIGDLNDPAVDGSYALTTDSSGIRIDAPTDIGVLHALATLYQSMQHGADGWYFPALRITDRPRFVWRGLMMDVCRHFMPRDVVLRELDGMELVKLNVLHLHLTEDQGFRIESKVFPELQEQGSNGQFLSQDDIRKIIHEADLRGIRVVPEFDLPGHSASWFVSHPELASAPGPYSIETRFGVFGPTFDPTNEATYTFLDRFLGEMAALFPDPYMHIGGDENNGKQWDANAAIQAFMKKNGMKDNQALQAYFNQRIYAILKAHGKRMIGWDEIGDANDSTATSKAQGLPKDITIQSWRGPEGLVKAARAGHDVILSNGWYIDLCYSAEKNYLNDPLPADSPLSAEERSHVLGGEATMWAELVDARNVDTRIWPITAAIAERLWSASSVNDVADMYRRLELVSAQLDEIGPRHKSAQLELLRLIDNSDDVTALKSLVNVLTPVPGYKRHSLGVHTTLTPVTGLADAAVPDPEGARRISNLIDTVIAHRTATDAAALRQLLETEMKEQAGLACCRKAVAARAMLDRSALAAIDALTGNGSMTPGPCAGYKKALDGAKVFFQECIFADGAAFKRLFAAACQTAR